MDRPHLPPSVPCYPSPGCAAPGSVRVRLSERGWSPAKGCDPGALRRARRPAAPAQGRCRLSTASPRLQGGREHGLSGRSRRPMWRPVPGNLDLVTDTLDRPAVGKVKLGELLGASAGHINQDPILTLEENEPWRRKLISDHRSHKGSSSKFYQMSWLPGTVLIWEYQIGSSSHIPVTFIQAFEISRSLSKRQTLRGTLRGHFLGPSLLTGINSPRARCRRRGLGAALGEGGGSRAGGGPQDEASDSAPSRSGLQCSSYKRRVGSVSCFLGTSRGSGQPTLYPPCFLRPGVRIRPSARLSPFLPAAVPGVPEALGKRVVVDLQLCNLWDRGSSIKSRPDSSKLAGGTPKSAATSYTVESRGWGWGRATRLG